MTMTITFGDAMQEALSGKSVAVYGWPEGQKVRYENFKNNDGGGIALLIVTFPDGTLGNAANARKPYFPLHEDMNSGWYIVVEQDDDKEKEE